MVDGGKIRVLADGLKKSDVSSDSKISLLFILDMSG
jgi:hypothetical protein